MNPTTLTIVLLALYAATLCVCLPYMAMLTRQAITERRDRREAVQRLCRGGALKV